MWSTSPAARNSRIVMGPPPMRTSIGGAYPRHDRNVRCGFGPHRCRNRREKWRSFGRGRVTWVVLLRYSGSVGELADLSGQGTPPISGLLVELHAALAERIVLALFVPGRVAVEGHRGVHPHLGHLPREL